MVLNEMFFMNVVHFDGMTAYLASIFWNESAMKKSGRGLYRCIDQLLWKEFLLTNIDKLTHTEKRRPEGQGEAFGPLGIDRTFSDGR